MKLNSHTVYWFFPFHFQAPDAADTLDLPPLTLGMLEKAAWMARVSALPGKNDEELVWQKDSPCLKSDLLPHVERLLGMEGERTEQSPAMSMVPLSLSDKAMALLGNRRCNLGLGLSPSALRRIGLSDQLGKPHEGKHAGASVVLPFKIDSVRMFRFGTGTGLLILEAQFGKPERENGEDIAIADEVLPLALLEGNHVLGHPSNGGNFFWRANYALAKKADGFLSNETLLLTSIAETLLQGITGFRIASDDSRLYSYTSVTVTETTPDSARDYACRLARRYTTDYAVNQQNFSVFSPFQDVIHVAEYEGAASLVESSRTVEFLNDYLNKVIRPTLLPMLILAQHEHHFLLNLVEASSTGYLAEKSEQRKAEFLQGQRARYLDYRLNYRFEYAARLSPQNGVYRLWRAALNADEIAFGLDADLANIAALELEKHQARVEKEGRAQRASVEKYERLKVVLITIFGAFITLDKVFEILLKAKFVTNTFAGIDNTATALAAAATISACLGFLAWRFKSPIVFDDQITDMAETISK